MSAFRAPKCKITLLVLTNDVNYCFDVLGNPVAMLPDRDGQLSAVDSFGAVVEELASPEVITKDVGPLLQKPIISVQNNFRSVKHESGVGLKSGKRKSRKETKTTDNKILYFSRRLSEVQNACENRMKKSV